MKIFPDNNNDEPSEYAMFMDFVCTSTVKESVKEINGNNLSNEQIANAVKELRVSIGQVVLDDVIAHTKDWTREQLIEMLTEVSMTHGMSVMEENPLYKAGLVLRLQIFGK